MISAREALALDRAKFPTGDMPQLRSVMRTIEQHVRKTMTFNGTPELTIPYRDMTKEVSKLLCHAMKRLGWSVIVNLMSTAPMFAGGMPDPHHWSLHMQPSFEVYDDMPEISSLALLGDLEVS
jgi:hypothetical protein